MRYWYVWTALAVLSIVVAPVLGEAGSNTTKRDLSDFLEAQGTLDDPPLYFPDVPDYQGWVDTDFVTFALIDYAGLADAYVGDETGTSLGTSVKGKVTEQELSDGTAEITVKLRARNALAFAQSVEDVVANEYDFLATPTIFGFKAQEVVEDGETPSLGWVHLDTSFMISEPGADLPDFLALFADPGTYSPITLKFNSMTIGARPDGTEASLRVHQVGETVQDEDGVWGWVFSKEVVEVKDLDD